MKPHRTTFVFIGGSAFLGLCLLLLSLPARTEDKNAAAPSTGCWTFKTEAAFVGLAYNHLVHLHNACADAVSCRVKTDVNPKEETIDVPAGGHKTQLTFRGSPAREFKAQVTCTEK